LTEKLIYQSRNSQIYLLEESEWNFPVIRKTLNSEYPPPSEISRFYNEFDILSGVSIDGTRRVLKRDRHKRKHALYLEYIDAKTLADAFKGKHDDILDFLYLAIAIARAVGDIHQHHIIHKDISANNILVDLHARTARVIDFGISSRLSLKTPHLGNPERLEGNLHYISPEQTGRMNRVVDSRSDLYSMGVVFYEMLAGRTPFEAHDAMEMVHAHIALKPTPLCEVNENVPRAISAIVDKLLQKNAEDRYQTAYGVAEDLEHCLAQLTSGVGIQPFELGRNDHSGKFTIVQKLYGREREVTALMDTFDEVCDGRLKMVLVAGYSGTGKSALVHEIHKPITGKRGYFIEGKFDQFQRGVPYFAILQAFRDYVNLLLTESEKRLSELKDIIQQAIGREGRVLTDVIPNLSHIIGDQPPVPEVGGMEAQNRFNYVFRKFIRAISTADHPIALFIDDLQWADAASLNLLEVLMSDHGNGYLLCIGAYRDNEVGHSHPLMIAIAQMRENGVDASTIEIGNLSEPDIDSMISDSLRRPVAEIRDLTRLVLDKTRGNAFFVNQFLNMLYHEGLLYFEREGNRWQWNADRIRELDITDNVVDLMAKKISRLPESTQDAMKLAACIGNSFDPATLSVISERGAGDINRALHEALAAGLLTPLGNLIRFSHDRIQQAVYSLIAESDRKSVHLDIGRLLLRDTPLEEQEDILFDIVNQLNSGRDIINDPEERIHLASLNLRAGIKAKQASAFRPAYQYLETGIALLPDDHWQSLYELSRDLHTQAAETAYLNGDFPNMEEKINAVLDNARDLQEKVVPYEIRILAYKAQNRLIDATHTGIDVLRQLGERFPVAPTMAHVALELTRTRARLGRRDVARLAELPEMTDPGKIAAMRIIADIASCAYWATPALFPLLICRMCRMSLRYGNTALSAFGFATYGVILCGVLGAMKTGYEFGKLGLVLQDRFSARQWLTQIYTPIYALINNWNEHVESTLKPLQESYHIGLETGAIEFACINANIYCIHAFLSGRELVKIESETRAYSASFAQYKQETNFHYNEVYHQCMLNFMGQSENPLILAGEAYDEVQMAAQNQDRNDKTGTFFIHFNKLILSCFFHDYQRANQHAERARELLDAVLAKFEIPNHHFYESLSLLAVYSSSGAGEKRRIMSRVRGNLRKLRKWAGNAPQNYRHKVSLVEAERARVLDRIDRARIEYDRAIEGASRNRFIHEEALALELAGKFYIQCKRESLADYHLKAAYNAYREWGAEAKLRHLEERYPENISHSRGSFQSLGVTTSLHGVSTVAERSMLDLTTVLKASTAISGEIVLKNLLRTLMRIVIENAGAQRGILLLEKDGALLVYARYETEAEDVEVLQGIRGQLGESPCREPVAVR
jgi:histidine kinase